MVKCESCRVNLVEDARFCSSCGSSVGKTYKEEFKVSSDNLVGEVKRLLHEGNVTKILVKDELGKTLLEIPAWAGVVGVVLAPWLAALGAIGALAARCTITVVRRK